MDTRQASAEHAFTITWTTRHKSRSCTHTHPCELPLHTVHAGPQHDTLAHERVPPRPKALRRDGRRGVRLQWLAGGPAPRVEESRSRHAHGSAMLGGVDVAEGDCGHAGGGERKQHFGRGGDGGIGGVGDVGGVGTRRVRREVQGGACGGKDAAGRGKLHRRRRASEGRGGGERRGAGSRRWNQRRDARRLAVEGRPLDGRRQRGAGGHDGRRGGEWRPRLLQLLLLLRRWLPSETMRGIVLHWRGGAR
eukprot:scaffold3177_cov86-Phaeocystis_antarctica.AAC.17